MPIGAERNGIMAQNHVDYKIKEGENIPVIADGRVIYVGYSAYLGNFTVVDHGAGVRTWYTHLSLVNVIEGEELRAGDTVGRAGRSGFTTTSGTLIMCTVGGIFVSPYKLMDEGILGKWNP